MARIPGEGAPGEHVGLTDLMFGRRLAQNREELGRVPKKKASPKVPLLPKSGKGYLELQPGKANQKGIAGVPGGRSDIPYKSAISRRMKRNAVL